MARKKKISNTKKYLRVRFVSVIIATFALFLLPILLIVISQKTDPEHTPYKLNAGDYLKESYDDIDVTDVLSRNGSAAIVDKNLNVKILGKEAIFDNDKLTEKEWTEFLRLTGKESDYYYDVAFYEGGENSESYWLVLREPRAILFVILLSINPKAVNYKETSFLFVSFFALYFIALAVFIILYSKKAAAELNAMEKLKTEEEEKRMLLVSELSHDLKTPLASVQGYSEMLLNGVDDEEKKNDYLKMIHDNSVRADGILKALFTYSKLGSSGYDPKLEKTDICEFTRLIIAEYIPRFEDAKFKYEIDVPEDEINVQMNADLFRRVYDNLFENSMKYNEEGTLIGISLKKENGRVYIRVFDDGKGISKENREKIFEPFYRENKTGEKNKNGSGLGLAIVKRIIELHKGEITYKPKDDKGCGYLIVLSAKI